MNAFILSLRVLDLEGESFNNTVSELNVVNIFNRDKIYFFNRNEKKRNNKSTVIKINIMVCTLQAYININTLGGYWNIYIYASILHVQEEIERLKKKKYFFNLLYFLTCSDFPSLYCLKIE